MRRIVIPALPKPFDGQGIRDAGDLARRTLEWARAAEDVLRALRSMSEVLDRDLAVLEAVPPAEGGGGAGMTFDAPGTIEPDDAIDEGTSPDAARADHTHGIATATAGSIEPDDAAAEGSASSFARSDHKHGIAAAIAGAATPGDSAAEGAATSFSRSDHRHSLPAFGRGSGEFAEGDDLDDVDDRLADVEAYTTNPVYTKWDPDAPPASPHADDEEFSSAGGLPSGWAEWDVATNTTCTVADGALRIEKTNTGGVDWSGAYRAIPAGNDWTVSAKISRLTGTRTGSGAAGMGLMIAQDLATNPTTADLVVLGLTNSTTLTGIVYRSGITGQTNAGTVSNAFEGDNNTIYVRARLHFTGAVWQISPEFSTDGEHFALLGGTTAFSLGIVPVHVGFAFWNQTGITARLYAHWFRVTSTFGTLFDRAPGREVAVHAVP